MYGFACRVAFCNLTALLSDSAVRAKLVWVRIIIIETWFLSTPNVRKLSLLSVSLIWNLVGPTFSQYEEETCQILAFIPISFKYNFQNIILYFKENFIIAKVVSPPPRQFAGTPGKGTVIIQLFYSTVSKNSPQYVLLELKAGPFDSQSST